MVTKNFVALFVGMFFMVVGVTHVNANGLSGDVGTAPVRISGDTCEIVSYAILHKTTGVEYAITGSAGVLNCNDIHTTIINNGQGVEIVDTVSSATDWKRCFRNYRVAQFFNVFSREISCPGQ